MLNESQKSAMACILFAMAITAAIMHVNQEKRTALLPVKAWKPAQPNYLN